MPVNSGFCIVYCQVIVQSCPQSLPSRHTIQMLATDVLLGNRGSDAVLVGISEPRTDLSARCYSINFLLTT